MLLARRIGNDIVGWKLENCPLTPSCPSALVNYATYLYTSTLRSSDEQDLQHAILKPLTIMQKLVRFNYLYRDGGNYKRWGSVDFENPEKLSIKEIDKLLRSCFEQQCCFIAHQIDIPKISLYADEPISEDDHCFHECDSVIEVEHVDSSKPSRTIGDFAVVIQ